MTGFCHQLPGQRSSDVLHGLGPQASDASSTTPAKARGYSIAALTQTHEDATPVSKAKAWPQLFKTLEKENSFKVPVTGWR